MKRVLIWVDVVFFLTFAAYIAARVEWTPRTCLGLALATMGFVLWMTARQQLGSSFRVKAEAHTLVTSGLYSKFRHPVYLSGFFAYAGLFVMVGRWIPFLIFVLLYSLQLKRVRREDRVLEDAFGDEYRQYRAQTWM